MNDQTITRIEQDIVRLEQDRAKAAAANDSAIQKEESRKTGHTDIQAAAVEALQAKKDSIMQAYDQLRERKAVELATARTQKAVREADENAANETQAAKLKATALRAYLAAGGLLSEFEEHYKGIVIARTVAKMDQENRFVLPKI